MKQECHEKNQASARNFLWEVWTPEGALKSQKTKFAVTDAKVRKLAMKYFPEKMSEKVDGNQNHPKKPKKSGKTSFCLQQCYKNSQKKISKKQSTKCQLQLKPF